jgi:hypothetical protein
MQFCYVITFMVPIPEYKEDCDAWRGGSLFLSLAKKKKKKDKKRKEKKKRGLERGQRVLDSSKQHCDKPICYKHSHIPR